MTKVGILGAGQLGLMLSDAADLLGIEVSITDVLPNQPAYKRLDFKGASTWREARNIVSDKSDVITIEREHVPLNDIDCHLLQPNAKAIKIGQDRLEQKKIITKLGIPTAKWFSFDKDEPKHDLKMSFPLMIKSRYGGFDGRGQKIVKNVYEFKKVIDEFDKDVIVEELIDFDDEFSIIIVCGNHQTYHYPLTLTKQVNGQLLWSLTPHPKSNVLTDWSQSISKKISSAVDYKGVLAIECFRIGDKAIVNEIAPRVHNSGHWTITGSRTSQFSNHLLAITDQKLGSTEMTENYSLLLNCIGNMPSIKETHDFFRMDYGKEPRPNRKVGHLSIESENLLDISKKVNKLPEYLKIKYKSFIDYRKAL